MFAPWAIITPSAPASGTSISAVTECDLFLMFRTQFSDRRPMPPKSSWVFPLISTGRPAVSGLNFSQDLYRPDKSQGHSAMCPDDHRPRRLGARPDLRLRYDRLC